MNMRESWAIWGICKIEICNVQLHIGLNKKGFVDIATLQLRNYIKSNTPLQPQCIYQVGVYLKNMIYLIRLDLDIDL